MKKCSKGFTYYELLIVIAIMSLMVGFTTISLSTVYRNNVYRSADSIESSIKQARNNSIAKGSQYGYVNFYYKDDVIYSYVGERVDNTFNFSTDTRNWEKVTYNIDDLTLRFDDGAGVSNFGPFSGTLFNLRFKQSTGELISLEFPYGGYVYYLNEFEMRVHKNHNDANIHVNKYGNIEIE